MQNTTKLKAKRKGIHKFKPKLTPNKLITQSHKTKLFNIDLSNYADSNTNIDLLIPKKPHININPTFFYSYKRYLHYLDLIRF